MTMISQKVSQFARKNGFNFYVSGLGYRATAQITNLDGSQAISRCSNNSKAALTAINALIKQRELEAESNEAIATQAEQAVADLLPPVVAICETVAEAAYQELLPVDPWEQRRALRSVDASDFAPIYTPRDNFGDNDFALSARYSCGALV
jgi:hypothetical protein